jgi:hypothetical protein
MLRELFADELRQFPGLEAKFFTTSAYSLLLGGLNLNTISIKVPSPLGACPALLLVPYGCCCCCCCCCSR